MESSGRNNLIYLDNATTSWPKPDSIYRFMVDFYRGCSVSPGRSGFDKAVEAGNIVEDLRLRLTKFFGGDEHLPQQLCFGYNATDALNLLIQGSLTAGDHVVTTNVEHNSVIRPINHLVRDGGVEATYVPFDGHGFVDPDDIKKAFRKNTRLVVVNHGSNVLGTIQPIKEIGRYCREVGIRFMIDSSQTAGVVPINMREANLDALAFTGHKSLMGSTGIGGVCVREGVEIRHTRSGGTGVASAYPYHLDEYPYRLEYGTPNMVGIASLWAGQDWIDEQGGVTAIHAQETELVNKLIDGFKNIDGVTVYCCDSLENHLPTVLMNVDVLKSGDVGIMLDGDFDIATRTGLHCAPLVHKQLGLEEIDGGVRFAVGPFNTKSHIDKAIEAVTEIAERAKSMKKTAVASKQ